MKRLLLVSFALAFVAACSPAATPTTLPTVPPSSSTPSSQSQTGAILTVTAPHTPVLKSLSLDERKAVFEQTWALVRDKWIYNDDFRGLNWQQLHDDYTSRVAAAITTENFYGLMHEMIKKLGDNHSYFDSPQEAASEDQAQSGTEVFGGIGVSFSIMPEGAVILRIVRGGPADLAGLKVGEIIQSVNDVTVSTLEAGNGFVGAVRGPVGTSVRMSIQSVDGKSHSVDIVRRVLTSNDFDIPEVSRLPSSHVGILVIKSFNVNDMDAQVKTQLQKLVQEGPLDGLVIDVRANSGGLTNVMLGTLALFNDGGSIGTFGARTVNPLVNVKGDMTIKQGVTIPELKNVPIVVLASPFTESAAEIFASGMQVLRRARIIGMPSKGNTERILRENLSDGSRLWLAEQIYVRPDGKLLEGKGVQPDRVADSKWYLYVNNPMDDPQIKAALEELKKK